MIADLAKAVVWVEDKTREGVQSAQKNLQGLQNDVETFKGKWAALGSLLGVGAFAAIVKSQLDEIAALKDLQEQYGATAENLSLLREMHRLAGRDMNELGGVFGKLSKNMVESLDPLSKQAEALRSLGVSAVDAAGKLKTPDQVLIDLARNLGKYEKGANTVAALQALMGKEAAKYISVMNELAAAEEYRVKLTDEQIEQADQVGKNFTKLTASTKAFWTILSAELAPVMNDVIRLFLAIQNESGGMRSKIQGVAQDGSLREWFRTIVLWAAYGVDGLQYFARGVQTLGMVLGSSSALLEDWSLLLSGVGLILGGQFSHGAQVVSLAIDKIKAGVKGTMEDIRQVWNQPVASDRVTKALYETATAAETAGGTLKNNFTGGAGEAAKATQRLHEAYQALLTSLGGDIAKLQFEIDYLNKYGEAAQSAAVAVTYFEMTQGKLKGNNDPFGVKLGVALSMAAMKDYLAFSKKATEDFAKADKEQLEKTLKENVDYWNARRKTVTETTVQLNEDLRAMGAEFIIDEQARARYLLDIEADKHRRIIQLAAEGSDQRKEIEAAFLAWYQKKQELIDMGPWRKAYDSLSEGLTEAIMRGFEDGKSFAKNFRDLLVNQFKTLVLRPLIQPIMGSVAGGVLGMFSQGANAAGIANGAAGAGNIFSGASSLISGGFIPGISGFSAGAGVAAPGFGGAATAAIDSFMIANGMGGMAGGALTGALGMLSAAMPYVAIAVALYSMFAKPGGGPKSGGSFMGGWDPTGAFGGSVRVPGSDNGRFFTPNDADPGVRAIVEATSKGFFETIRSLGGSTSGVQFGLGYDTDPKGTAPNRISSAVYVGGRRVFGSQDRDVGRDEATLQAELQLEAQRALLAALQASDLPETVATIINSLDVQSASVDAINNALALATAVNGFLDATKALSAGDLIQESQRTAYEAFRAQGRALTDMARSATLSTESIQNLTQATAAYRAAAASLILEFQNARANVGSTIEGAIFNYRLAGMDQQGQYNFLQAEADKIMAGIVNLTDAQQITDAVRRATELSNQAFGMLSPEERMQKSAEFIAGLEELRRQADTRLAALQQQITDSANEQLTTIKGIVTDLVNAQKDAASTTQQAANTLNQGAQTFSEAVGRGIDIRVPAGFGAGPSEVGA